MHQDKYCKDFLVRYGFDDAHCSSTPMETIAKFITQVKKKDQEPPPFDYLVRPGIAFAVSSLSRFGNNPTKKHCGALKRILWYLAGSSKLGIVYPTDESKCDRIIVSGHCDADWGNDPDARKSVTGFVMTIAGGAVAWASRHQTIIAQSTEEAGFVTACEATIEGRGIVNMLDEDLPKIAIKPG
ncbi:Integrase catalytic core protein [Phytophthora palmivora]|uniref:Integrase catalytic core protein n=1 Tax=Phytophthora palmivora TaxID=4796 RepID=A0A2P4YDI3_9STRA|nr:Integrase catalytic core protein [Phytophthora palmivora]